MQKNSAEKNEIENQISQIEPEQNILEEQPDFKKGLSH